MNQSALIGVSCLLVGGAVGYMAGGGKNSEPSAIVESGAQTRASERTPSSSGDRATDKSGSSYEEITSQPGQTTRIQALIDLYSNLDPDKYAQEAEKLDDLPFSERILAAYLLFAAWAEVSPMDAMDHTKTRMGFAGNFVKPTVLQSWAATDPTGAAEYFKTNQADFRMMGMMGRRGGRGSNSGAAVVAGEWAKQDPQAALQWASSLEGRDGDQATASVLKQLAKSDPGKAAQMITNVDESNRSAAYESIAVEWAKKSWGETENWISSLPSDAQDSTMSAAITSLASENPQLAADKALMISQGEMRDEAMEEVAGQLAKDNPAGAMDWLIKNGSEEGQKDAVGDVIGPWVSQDPQGALSWVRNQPEGAVRDAAVQSYVFNDQDGAGQDNVSLAESIGDERTRERAVGMAAWRWMGQDKEAAAEYVENTDQLSDRAKQRVMRGAERGRYRGR